MTVPDGGVRVVVATSTCLTLEQAHELGIILVPLRIGVDGRDYRDMIDITPAELYRLLRERVIPTTAAPTLGDYLTAFDSASGPVLCLTVGSRISAMDEAARLAAEASANGRVEVLETGTAAGGLRLVALAAARLAAEGLDLDELSRRVRDICERVEMAGMLETVEFLARSGRVPEIAHWGSSVLKVRPVVRFQAGSGSLVSLVRSPSRGLDEMRKLVRQGARRQGAGACGQGLSCTVFHGDALELAEELEARLRQDLPAADLSISEMTAAMAIHVGPGVVGEAFYVDPAGAG
ncbi:MAG TPA: DegV family protein [Candidatus Eisenbacteria bacterium]|nr:DegV family protein [Candidatus Eisenbacteria bacterium]